MWFDISFTNICRSSQVLDIVWNLSVFLIPPGVKPSFFVRWAPNPQHLHR